MNLLVGQSSDASEMLAKREVRIVCDLREDVLEPLDLVGVEDASLPRLAR